METKEEGLDYLDDLQDWQKEILKWEDISQFHMKGEDEVFPITKAQRKMLEIILGDDFYISDEKVRETLEAVLELGFYYERDRKVLNLAREYYLKGKNWIKRSYR
jgi:flagellar assembly factor FliW